MSRSTFRYRQATPMVGPWSKWEVLVMLLALLVALVLVCAGYGTSVPG